jgi:hypothetical protein
MLRQVENRRKDDGAELIVAASREGGPGDRPFGSIVFAGRTFDLELSSDRHFQRRAGCDPVEAAAVIDRDRGVISILPRGLLLLRPVAAEIMHLLLMHCAERQTAAGE